MTPPGSRLPDLSVLFPFRAWLHHPALRAWTTWLFVALVATPPMALAMFPKTSDLTGVAVMFAAYFAVAWFLVLWVVVRPQGITSTLLAQIVGAETVLVLLFVAAMPASDLDVVEHLVLSVSLIGIPEELVKVLPAVVVVALNRRMSLAPRDVLFLAATSGLVFGAIEAVHYAPIHDYSGDAITMVWRFATDPISHALWAGVAGYFVGLAMGYRQPGPWFALAGLGVGVPALLHGINDWEPVTGGVAWAILQVVSALLFLAYARVGLVDSRPPRPVAPPLAPAPRPVSVDPPTAPIALPHHGPGRHAMV